MDTKKLSIAIITVLFVWGVAIIIGVLFRPMQSPSEKIILPQASVQQPQDRIGLPGSFPTTVPIYPGSDVVIASSDPIEGIHWAGFETIDTIEMVQLFFAHELSQAGWRRTSQSAVGATYRRGAVSMLLTIDDESGVTSINVILGPIQ